MEFASIFLLPDGRLRAGWRLLLFLVFFVAASIVFQGTASAFFRRQVVNSPIAILAVASVAGLAAVALATSLMASVIERQSFSSVGLSFRRQSLGELTMGFAGGVGLAGTAAVIEWVVGAIHFEPSGTSTASALSFFVGGVGIFAISATSEELLFRGYPFQRLIEGTNDYSALLISSVVFGGLHWLNPHSTKLSVTNTVLAGVLLSLAYIKTRALWLPIGFHFSWNWTLALLGLPVSGVEFGRMPWQAMPASIHIWLHGGDYGPEGGLVATGVLVVGVIFLIRRSEKDSQPRGGISPT